MLTFRCPRCGSKISTKKEDVSEGYFGACINCDQDFYSFELEAINSMFTRIIFKDELIIPEELETKKVGDEIDFLHSVSGSVVRGKIMAINSGAGNLMVQF